MSISTPILTDLNSAWSPHLVSLHKTPSCRIKPWTHLVMGQASWPKSSRKGIGVYTPTNKLTKLVDKLGYTWCQAMEDLAYLPSEGRILPSSQNCQVVLPTCWRLFFVVLAKILKSQVFFVGVALRTSLIRLHLSAKPNQQWISIRSISVRVLRLSYQESNILKNIIDKFYARKTNFIILNFYYLSSSTLCHINLFNAYETSLRLG